MTSIHARLDALKLLTAIAVLNHVGTSAIRVKGIANLDRWNSNGVWVSAHDEWRVLLTSGSDDELIAVMTGRTEHANRLRQSPPYTGLLSPQVHYELMRQVGFEPPSISAEACAAQFIDRGVEK